MAMARPRPRTAAGALLQALPCFLPVHAVSNTTEDLHTLIPHPAALLLPACLQDHAAPGC